MKYQTCDWLGKWKNFESYINSDDPYLEKAWQDAEAAAGKMPMFQGGAKKFWQKVCVTVTPENPHVLGGWNITAADAALCIEWLAEDGTSLGSSIYHLNSVLEKGLEGRENFLFVAEDAAPDWAFRCLLAMEPMPQRGSYQTGGLLSHLHFQYAPQPEALFDPETKNCAIRCGMRRCARTRKLCWSSATSCARCTDCRCGKSCRKNRNII